MVDPENERTGSKGRAGPRWVVVVEVKLAASATVSHSLMGARLFLSTTLSFATLAFSLSARSTLATAFHWVRRNRANANPTIYQVGWSHTIHSLQTPLRVHWPLSLPVPELVHMDYSWNSIQATLLFPSTMTRLS